MKNIIQNINSHLDCIADTIIGYQTTSCSKEGGQIITSIVIVLCGIIISNSLVGLSVYTKMADLYSNSFNISGANELALKVLSIAVPFLIMNSIVSILFKYLAFYLFNDIMASLNIIRTNISIYYINSIIILIMSDVFSALLLLVREIVQDSRYKMISQYFQIPNLSIIFPTSNDMNLYTYFLKETDLFSFWFLAIAAIGMTNYLKYTKSKSYIYSSVIWCFVVLISYYVDQGFTSMINFNSN